MSVFSGIQCWRLSFEPSISLAVELKNEKYQSFKLMFRSQPSRLAKNRVNCSNREIIVLVGAKARGTRDYLVRWRTICFDQDS